MRRCCSRSTRIARPSAPSSAALAAAYDDLARRRDGRRSRRVRAAALGASASACSITLRMARLAAPMRDSLLHTAHRGRLRAVAGVGPRPRRHVARRGAAAGPRRSIGYSADSCHFGCGARRALSERYPPPTGSQASSLMQHHTVLSARASVRLRLHADAVLPAEAVIVVVTACARNRSLVAPLHLVLIRAAREGVHPEDAAEGAHLGRRRAARRRPSCRRRPTFAAGLVARGACCCWTIVHVFSVSAPVDTRAQAVLRGTAARSRGPRAG